MRDLKVGREYVGDEYYGVRLWTRNKQNIQRVERVYWATRKRAERTYARFAAATTAIIGAGGVAYCRCYGGCEKPCFYRFIAEVSVDGDTSWLDCHAVPENGGLRASFGGAVLPESEPIHLELGEEYWSAMEAMKEANGRWLSWKAATIALLAARLPDVNTERTARVSVNGRDWWFGSKRRHRLYEWCCMLAPEEERVEMNFGGPP